MKSKWSNVAGQFTVEVYLDDEVVRDAHNDKEIKPLAGYVGLDDAYELVIDFRSSGYYDSGSMYGGADNLGYPPESDDERLLECAYLTDGNEKVKLPQATQDALFDLFLDKIEDVEIDTED